MHTPQFLAVLLTISSVQAIGKPPLLKAALSRRQDSASVPAPLPAVSVPSPAAPIPAPDSSVLSPAAAGLVGADPALGPDADHGGQRPSSPFGGENGGGNGQYPPFGGASGQYPPSGGASGQYSPSGGASGQYPPSGGANGQYPPSGGASGQYPPSGGASGQYPPSGGASGQYPPSGGASGQYPSSGGANGQCPPIWYTISKDLTLMFMENGQCNDLARGAIRAAFHDCAAYKLSMGTSGGCDGSLFLAPEEIERIENAGLREVVPKLGALAQKYGVGMADFFQFAGAHAVKTCPLGPTVQVFIGRKDSTQAPPEGLIPNPRSPGDELVKLFEDKGISPTELAALIGAHTTAKQRVFDPSMAGTPLDSTPGIWDIKYYQQVLQRTAPFILPSDAALAKNAATGGAFRSFAASQGGWSAAYSPAMTHLGLLGVERAGLIDCTAALPRGGYKRHAAPAKRSWWQNAW